MTATYSELRARARASLRGNWGKAIGGLVILGLISVVLNLLNEVPALGLIASLLVGGALGLGATSFYLGIARGANPPVSDVFSGFKNFVNAFVLYLLMGIFVFLWTLLLIVPGIIASFRYSMAYYIMKENPDISPLDAIRQSKELMAGHKWRFFVLNLTFIGWALLAILTLGIGYLWLAPYIYVTQAHFYDDLKASKSVPPPPLPPFGYNSSL